MSNRTVRTALICIACAAILGFFFSGYYLARTFIGLDPAGFPAGDFFQAIGSLFLPNIAVTTAGVVISLGSVLLAAVATFFIVRRDARSQSIDEASRRSFLTGSLAGAAGAIGAAAVGGGAMAGRALLGIGNEGRGWNQPLSEIFGARVVKTHPEWKSAWKGSRVQRYGRLGRTGFEISDIVMGTGPLKGEEGERVVNLALDRGVNYIDTAPDYSGAASETIVGRALGSRRDEVFLTTKWCTPIGHLPAGAPVADYKEVIHESLRRLRTDHVDLVHVHSCDEIDRLMDPNMHEAFDLLKAEGKVSYLGFSSHTPNLVQVAGQAIDSGRFDVMMLAYHHGIWPGLSDVIARAVAEQDMGIVAMKTLKGARHRGLEDYEDFAESYAQAALKWVNANPNVSCAVISMFEMQQVDEYLYASGKQLDERDLAILREYDARIAGTYCSPHCGDCSDSCPVGVPIADVLRHRMYFEDYGNEKQAMSLYAALEKNASACVGCPAPCAGSCSHGLSIQDRMLGAHEMLSFGGSATS